MNKKTGIGAAAALLIIVGICLLAYLGGRRVRPQTAQTDAGTEGIRIGFTLDSLILERWQRDRDVFVSAAQELGADVNIQNANGDMQEQIAQIDYFIEKQMDVIVVVQVASDEDQIGLRAALGRAKRAGIPVVAYDRLVLNGGVDYYVSFDNEAVGRLMGEHMREHLEEEGEILQICGPLSDYNVPQVMEGFAAAIEGSGIEVMETGYAEEWLGETGFTVAGDYLERHGTVAGIMCGNDSIAGNAIRALSERRLAGEVCVVGQDADLDACQRIVEGTQCMTVYKPVEALARRAAELAVALAEGEEVQAAETMNDGTYDVPYERMEPTAVTKDNMDEVITGKYHEESDIYLNVR
ncbi:MAG: substrate-binding domain-containing protein [Eubacteriales bacterium]|nr:substrate-binding domain-containing protein [Eubacteriales bacterium]